MKRITNGFFNPVFPCSHASTHNGNATIFQRGVYIGKVEIYIAVNRDDFGYAFCCDRQRIIGLGKGIHHR
jgi:hypothetical protein